MSKWTHVICLPCWRKQMGMDEEPTVFIDAPRERCCYCGRPTTAGIYVRDDPATIEHHVPHREDD